MLAENTMITLTIDEVVLIKAILTALRGMNVRDIDRALVILSKKMTHPEGRRLSNPVRQNRLSRSGFGRV